MALQIGSVSELGLESARVSEFYSKSWIRKIALRDSQFYTWQFKSLPCSLGVDNCVVAYDFEKAEIAGVMGLNPRPFYLNGERLNGAELTTWIVAEEYRTTGAGGKMLFNIQENYDVLIGMGISDMALPVYLRSGFRYLRAIPRFIRVYDFDAVSTIAVADALAKKLVRQRLLTESQVRYKVVEGMSEIADELFVRSASTYNLFARDELHIRWRYLQHPIFTYRIFFVSTLDETGVAFVALRKENVIPGVNIFHVVDCFGDDSAMPAAFSFIDDFCRQEGAHIVDFFCSASRINKYPLSMGWFSTLDDINFSFPHLFHPVEIRNPATTSLIYWSKKDFLELCDFSKLYITKEDADFDRPVLTSE